MKIIVAGGTGLIGSALLKRLAGKNDVVILTRRAEEAHRQFEGAGFHILDWNQPKEQLVAALDKSDALINLSGAGIADFRWTDKRKAALLKSRIEPIRKLTHLMREANLRIGMIIQAS
ncbi:MAG TPA: NAD-dependent epimerase/dehydratase family protein, partial [Bacteroidales bacterium]|nr:NAD-dependent epimerase/dehydratase family protein [Bacteroidales bacterium]